MLPCSNRLQINQEVLDDTTDEEDEGSSTNNPYTPESYADAADVIFSSRRGTVNLQGLHPPGVHIFKHWQLYMENVNPVSKIVHTPSFQKTLLNAAMDLGNVDKETETLLFAIYFGSVVSLTDEECLNTFGESQVVLQGRYHFCTQQALKNAGLLKTSDIRVLQAFSIFLASHPI
jgi:hypothetical protein